MLTPLVATPFDGNRYDDLVKQVNRHQEALNKSRWKRPWKLSGIASVTFVLLVAFALVKGRVYRPGDRFNTEFTSYGIGALVLAVVGSSFGFDLAYSAKTKGVMFHDVVGEFHASGIVLKPVRIQQHVACPCDRLGLSPVRLFAFGVIIGRCCLNLTTWISLYRDLPPRDPTEHLNASKYYVAWLQIIGIVGGGLYLLKHFLVLWSSTKKRLTFKDGITRLGCRPERQVVLSSVPSDFYAASYHDEFNDKHRDDVNRGNFSGIDSMNLFFAGNATENVGGALRYFADASVLKLMTAFSVAGLTTTFKNSSTLAGRIFGNQGVGCVVGALSTIGRLGMGWFGILAFLIKIDSVSFVKTEDYWDWTLKDWVELAGLVSNVAGIYSRDAACINEVLKVASFNSDNETDQKARMRLVLDYAASEAIRVYGPFRGFLRVVLWRATLSPDDVKNMLFEKDVASNNLAEC